MQQELGLDFGTLPREAAGYDHSHERLYVGLAASLKQLAESHRLGVIANQSAGVSSRLESLGIRDLFSVIVASAEVGLSKPDARIFAHAQSLAGCSAGDITMVGDRLDNHIGPAKASGWHTVRVLQGFSRMQEPRTRLESPDHTLDSVSEISSLLAAT